MEIITVVIVFLGKIRSPDLTADLKPDLNGGDAGIRVKIGVRTNGWGYREDLK